MKLLDQPSKSLEVEVSFISKNEIRQLNKNQRNIDKETDVLSFPFLEISGGKAIDLTKIENFNGGSKIVCLGSIAICHDVAVSQAIEFGHSYLREVCFLSLHGLLHLLGFDHVEKEDEEIMMGVSDMILARNKVYRGEK